MKKVIAVFVLFLLMVVSCTTTTEDYNEELYSIDKDSIIRPGEQEFNSIEIDKDSIIRPGNQ